MEQVYVEAGQILDSIYSNLEILEQAKNENDAQRTVQFIYEQLRSLDSKCCRLDELIVKETYPQRRLHMKYKIDQLKYDSQCLHATVMNTHLRLTSKWRANADREELLNKRFKPNDSTHLVVEDSEFMINDRLHSSNTAVDDLIAHGNAILDQIRTQGISLLGAKQKVFDVMQKLGLSSTTIGMIERRVGEDWKLFIVFCIAFIIFMYVFYKFWKGF